MMDIEESETENKVFYFRFQGGFNWVRSTTESEAEQHVMEKLRTDTIQWISLDRLIQEMSMKGWSISFKNDEIITFRRMRNDFSWLLCFVFLLFFVVPAIIYAIATASPKEETVSFPLR